MGGLRGLALDLAAPLGKLRGSVATLTFLSAWPRVL
jgi:hypothetical protein